MAKRCYNTFVVVDCKNCRIITVTSSARKAASMLSKGIRIEVWNVNEKIEVIYNKMSKEKNPMRPYIEAERDYIREKQQKAEIKNRCRRDFSTRVMRW